MTANSTFSPVEVNLDGSPTGGDWAMMILALVNIVVNLIAISYLVYWRTWAPIRAKQLDLLIISTSASFIWLLGTFSATRIIPQTGGMLECAFWSWWVQFVFGALLWISCIILRMYRLYVILIKTQMRMNSMKHPQVWMYTRLAVISVPGLIFFIAMTAIGASYIEPQPTLEGPFMKLCTMDTYAVYGVFAVSVAYMVPCVILIYQLRNIRKFLNEFREAKIAFACIVSCVVVYGVIFVAAWQLRVWGRVLAAMIILFIINVCFWTIVGRTIYGRLFHPEAFLEEFNQNKQKEVSTTPSSKKKGLTTTSSNRKSNAAATTGSSDRGSVETPEAGSHTVIEENFVADITELEMQSETPEIEVVES
ncbi:hypothetical protein CAOG_04382 [Capsaspora owczarzaki ATCC 30864]|uniref:G-protein coupled receptors family 3 profile domain-containing protein n=1 Tax=Capsaspora owczarzaki (strain ATCC 30864) TaxID=595528 RepID=A0A0D2WR73_CAPO3|nr:hypothetical protein CAOG_04382 [Capsaspora owczarzaki ATCC 30864]KJE93623.1 hypothetical protein CAOG_004382 [Capsaspora owczarzaki ATCC 30864]|eukprot:XP_004348210.1 hypothetical protein CAOG_04382 [Capsaspora owczarzaki ATCC 30864]